MRIRTVARAGLGVGAGAAALLAVYMRFVRPWHMRWGTTDEEVARRAPGDDIVAKPAFSATRAVTIDAHPYEIWPWLLQMGRRRAGWYAYDWIDNLGEPSAERIIPELQDLKAGDLAPLSPDGKRGFFVKAMETNSWMLWDNGKDCATWFWGIYPKGEDGCRLVTRVRVAYRWTSPWILFHLAMDVGDIVMMRKCMLGIKRRAEAIAAERRAMVETFENALLEGLKYG